MMKDLSHEFIQFALDTGALRFGEFKTKAGRLSPYFFNAGLFHDDEGLDRLTGGKTPIPLMSISTPCAIN